MSAMGHYPSEVEITNMINEVKYSAFTTMGILKEEIDLEEFIKLLVNHRPVVGFSKEPLEQAFKVLAGGADSSKVLSVDWSKLKGELTSLGENMSNDELSRCLEALIGGTDLPDGPIAADDFIQQVLGFEDVEA
jgi:Ca2+-binding EF-hand superfamily protein